jgi:hypothetical protein
VTTKPPPVVVDPGWDHRSETPRVDAFIEQLPFVSLADPIVAAQGVREMMLAWADFARELERELGRKVWPH